MGRNDSSLDHIQAPGLIFDTLKQNFSELTSSPMQMSDSHNTKPLPHEGVIEEWIRLNKAVLMSTEAGAEFLHIPWPILLYILVHALLFEKQISFLNYIYVS